GRARVAVGDWRLPGVSLPAPTHAFFWGPPQAAGGKTSRERRKSTPSLRSTQAAALLPRLSGDHIGPYRFNLFGIEHIIPRRHVALAVGHRIDETRASVARKGTQVDCPLRIGSLWRVYPVHGLCEQLCLLS